MIATSRNKSPKSHRQFLAVRILTLSMSIERFISVKFIRSSWFPFPFSSFNTAKHERRYLTAVKWVANTVRLQGVSLSRANIPFVSLVHTQVFIFLLVYSNLTSTNVQELPFFTQRRELIPTLIIPFNLSPRSQTVLGKITDDYRGSLSVIFTNESYV